ncbi:hypothetical protein B7463_g12520, partial [Scytalidium lignicola]
MANAHFVPPIFQPFDPQNQAIPNQEQQFQVPQGNQLSANHHPELDDIDIYNMSSPFFPPYFDSSESMQNTSSENTFDETITMGDPLTYDFMATWPINISLDPTPFIDTPYVPLQPPYMPEDVIFEDICSNQAPIDFHPLPALSHPFELAIQQFQYENSNSSITSSGSDRSNISNSPYTYDESSTSPSTTSSPPPSNITHPCPECPKTFPKRHLLNRHVKTHTKPNACPHPGCTYENATPRDLQRHINAHHPDSPHAKQMPKPVCPHKGYI